MTEEGKRLFKFAGIGLGGLFAVMIVIRLIGSLGGGGGTADVPKAPAIDPFAALTPAEGEEEEKIPEYSAKRRLIKLLHAHAFNHYRSGRLKDAIRLWETARYLDPTYSIIEIRLTQARQALNGLIAENTAIAHQDFAALRYERAIEYYQRAANYAADFDSDRFRDIQRRILSIEKKMAQ